MYVGMCVHTYLVSYDLVGSCPEGAVLGGTEVVVVTGTALRTEAGDTILANTGLPVPYKEHEDY